MYSVFANAKPEKKEDDIPVEKLFEEIGQLKMENDFLKKAALRSVKERFSMIVPSEIAKVASFFRLS